MPAPRLLEDNQTLREEWKIRIRTGEIHSFTY
jgi:hypothetical protein